MSVRTRCRKVPSVGAGALGVLSDVGMPPTAVCAGCGLGATAVGV